MTGSSDLDVVDVFSLLGRFAAMVPDLGFDNVTKIFQTKCPWVKFTDRKSQMEVDFVINNATETPGCLLGRTTRSTQTLGQTFYRNAGRPYW